MELNKISATVPVLRSWIWPVRARWKEQMENFCPHSTALHRGCNPQQFPIEALNIFIKHLLGIYLFLFSALEAGRGNCLLPIKGLE